MESGRQGGAAELHFTEEVNEPFHFDFAVRGRVIKEDRQLAMGLGVLLATKPKPLSPYAFASIHFFPVGNTDDAFSYGFGTPKPRPACSSAPATQRRPPHSC